MSMNRILAAILALVMVLGVAVCGTAPSASAAEEPRTITIGVWWDIYYDSTQEAVEDDPSYTGTLAAQMNFDNVKRVEEKYNVTFEYVNMTYSGVSESINTSILAGTPDCDIYLCELQTGVPAQMNGLALDLKTILPEDADILADQNVLNYLDLGDGKACLMHKVAAESAVEATYPLAFNLQLLEDNNLEDPRELYENGEWTWDKFVEYCKVLTQDTDGDGVLDQYGFTGFAPDVVPALFMSNGVSVAGGTTQGLTDAAAIEALQFYSDLYNVHNVCQPYDLNDFSGDVMRFSYSDGNVGFWLSAAWIADSNGDYKADSDGVEFDTVFVNWPVGPSGSQETNKAKLTGGAYWFIPNGCKDPEFVYNVWQDICNWYDGDTEVRDDAEALSWWYSCHARDPEIQVSNFDVMFDMGSREQFDMWSTFAQNISADYLALIQGTMTGSQWAETYAQPLQEQLNAYFG